MQEMNYFEMAMGALAGLVLFIYGVTRLATGLEEITGEGMRKFVK
jgi:phosphate:Na+ symporter